MVRHLVVAIVLGLLFVTCTSLRSVSTDDRRVLEAVIGDFISEHSHGRELLLLNTSLQASSGPVFFHEIVGRPAPLPPELMANLRTRMTHAKRLPAIPGIEQVSAAELQKRWPASSQNYQRTYVLLSFPGYTTQKDTAAVAVFSHLQGRCCAAGYIAVVERSSARWYVSRRVDEFIE
jgi:hypothetical protein